MISFSTAYSWLGSAVVFCLCPFMLFVIVRRKLYRRIAFFTAYLVLLLVSGIAVAWVSPTPYYYTLAWRYTYFGSEYALAILRLLTIAEISIRFLRGYPAIRALATRLLAGLGTILLVWTIYWGFINLHHIRRLLLMTDLRFECTQSILVLVLLFITVYYRIPLPRLYQLILIGIGLYASIQIANDALGMHEAVLPNSPFDYIRRGTIMISIVIWANAIWRASAVPDSEPALISQDFYDRVSPDVHKRLKDLNDRLAGLTNRSDDHP